MVTAKTQGILIGQAAAAAVLALEPRMGRTRPPSLISTTSQGPIQETSNFSPGPPFAAATGWGDVTPFVLNSSSDYRPKAPYALTSKKYAADLNEVKSLGAVAAPLAPPSKPRSPCSG